MDSITGELLVFCMGTGAVQQAVTSTLIKRLIINLCPVRGSQIVIDYMKALQCLDL